MAIQPDVIFVNGNVITVNALHPRAAALAVKGEWLAGVGTVDQVRALAGRTTRVVDLQGKTVVPGFNDAHNHMLSFGLGLRDIDLKKPELNTVEKVLVSVRKRVNDEAPNQWVVGRGYDDNKLAGRVHPTRWQLDQVAPENPVLLRHTSGHMCVVNSAALKLAGITGKTPDPEGGRIVRDPATGEATGLLQESAQHLVSDLLLPRSVDDVVEGLGAASDRFLSEGITSAQEAGVGGTSPLELAAYQRAVNERRLRVRVNLMIGVAQLQHLSGRRGETPRFALNLGLHSGLGGTKLRIGPVKIFADGSLIGRTAAMFEPFTTDRRNTGFFTTPPDELRRQILDAHRSGWQVAVHAIGDRAVSFVLDCYEEALAEHPRHDHRHRIEHCGVLNPELIARIKDLGVIPVPQQHFIGELGDGFIDNLGRERALLAYPQRTFIEQGIIFPGSSDRPVIDGAPLLGIHDAVNQVTQGGKPYAPNERLTAEEALRAYTLHSAYCSFEEGIKGSLEPGKLADFAVLSDDLTRVHASELASVGVLATVVGGEIAFARGPFAGVTS